MRSPTTLIRKARYLPFRIRDFTWPCVTTNLGSVREGRPTADLSRKEGSRSCPCGPILTLLSHRYALESAVMICPFSIHTGILHRMFILVDTWRIIFGDNSNSDASAMGQQLGSANSVFHCQIRRIQSRATR
jgi:hypothetical protein